MKRMMLLALDVGAVSAADATSIPCTLMTSLSPRYTHQSIAFIYFPAQQIVLDPEIH